MCVWHLVVYLCRVCVAAGTSGVLASELCSRSSSRGPAELEAPIRLPASRGSLIGVSHPPCVSGRRGCTSWSEPQRQQAHGAGCTRERDQTEQFFLFLLSTFPIFSQPALSAASNPCCYSARWFCLGRRRAEPEKRLWGSGEPRPLPSASGKAVPPAGTGSVPALLPSASCEGAWGQESSPETPLWLVPRWVWLCRIRGLVYEPFLHRLISARPLPLPQSARLAGYANVLGRVCLPVSLC